MMYTDFTAGDKNYRLRLNTRNLVALEKQLGCNPLAIFGDGTQLPTVTQMVNILYCSLLQYNHGITLDNAYDIFDRWIEDGNTSTDFIPIIVDIFKTSGLINNDEDGGEKNL